MNQYRMFFVQTSTRPLNMHLTLTKHGRFCKQNNQLPTKSHDELKDNSIVLHILAYFVERPTMRGLGEKHTTYLLILCMVVASRMNQT